MFTLYVTIQNYIIASIYIFMQTPTDLDQPNRVHFLTLIYAISGRFIKNKRILMYFLKIIIR